MLVEDTMGSASEHLTLARDGRLEEFMLRIMVRMLDKKTARMSRKVRNLSKQRAKVALEVAKRHHARDPKVWKAAQNWRTIQEAIFFFTEDVGSLDSLFGILGRNLPWKNPEIAFSKIEERLAEIRQLRSPPPHEIDVCESTGYAKCNQGYRW